MDVVQRINVNAYDLIRQKKIKENVSILKHLMFRKNPSGFVTRFLLHLKQKHKY